MTLPRWAYYLLGGGIVGTIAMAIARAPTVGAPLAAAVDGGPRRLPAGAPVVAKPGATYFVSLETHGVLNAATVAGVKSRAEAEGFRDVVVSTTRVDQWPALVEGDYFVRATFVGKAAKTFPRHVSVTFGSLDVLDAWEA